MPSSVTVAKVDGKRRVADWLAVPARVYAGDPAWIAPLTMQEKRRITPKHSPFFSFADVALFVAYQDERPVGRISAQINHRHREFHGGDDGHFGFFECIEDETVARALVEAAAAWLRERGCGRMIGPESFSLNEESGCLVEGFDIPPVILMPHGRPWFGPFLERCGCIKAMDLRTYRLRLPEHKARVARLARLAGASTRVSVRRIDMTRYKDEVRLLIDIFNDAWAGNWGFVPFSDAEVDAMVAEMKLFFKADYGRFVLVDGEPAGMMIALPNINEIIAPFKGALLPFNWIPLLWRLRRFDLRSCRLPLLGIRKAYQHTPLASGMLVAMVAAFLEDDARYPIDWMDLSWILETNKPVREMAELVTGPPLKVYRIYEKALS